MKHLKIKELYDLLDNLATEYGDDFLEDDALLKAAETLAGKLNSMQLDHEVMAALAAFLLLHCRNCNVVMESQHRALTVGRAAVKLAREHADLSERLDHLSAMDADRRVNDAVEEGITAGARLAARRGGMARNKLNQQGKSDVFKWLDENLSAYAGKLDAAADAIDAARVTSVGWRTIRSYVTEYRRLRRAGRK
ncbi:hypothetical protein [Burkholderia stagnalis]|uniref:hypothetical protein n=1 Tax=Burkholderia stagnalis TaxID=1503054 RepID=UPI000F599591|nr:hypothetical protein [Burkholderia stagnalis]